MYTQTLQFNHYLNLYVNTLTHTHTDTHTHTRDARHSQTEGKVYRDPISSLDAIIGTTASFSSWLPPHKPAIAMLG